MQTIYLFSTTTNEYVGSLEIEDGAELPANATLVAPPAFIAYKVRVWDGVDTWTQEDDYRGLVWVKATGAMAEPQTAIGPLPVENTHLMPPDFYENNPTTYTFEVDEWVINNNAVTAAQAAAVRVRRNQLLLESDFMVAPDCMIDNATLLAAAKYRQWLRDMPLQAGFPANPAYPVKPVYVAAVALETMANKETQIANGNAFAIANPM